MTSNHKLIKNKIGLLNLAQELGNVSRARKVMGFSSELRKRGVFISPAGVRSIWLRHGLERFQKRLVLLEKRSAEEGSDPDRGPGHGLGKEETG